MLLQKLDIFLAHDDMNDDLFNTYFNFEFLKERLVSIFISFRILSMIAFIIFFNF